MNFSRTIVTVFALLIATALVRADEVPGPRDPALFVMPERSPTFEHRAQGTDWEKVVAEVRMKLGDLGALERSTYAAAGSRIDRVDDDGQASMLGLKVGDTISEVDGVVLDQTDLRERRENHDQQLTIVGENGVARQVTVNAGMIGINSRQLVRPELVYLRHGKRDPKWDDFATVGAALCVSRPNVAETAWHEAFRAGYVADAISDYCGVQIAWRQGRPDDAVAYCAMLETRKDIPAALGHERLAREVALANFKLEQALGSRMAASPPAVELTNPDVAEWLQTLYDRHRALPEAQRVGPSPSEVASYVKANLLKDMRAWPNSDDSYTRQRADGLGHLVRGDEIELSAPSSHYEVLPFAPKNDAPDVELTVRGRVHATKPLESGAAATFMVSLVDGDDPLNPDDNGRTDGPHRRILTTFVEIWGTAVVRQRDDTGGERVVTAFNVGEAIANNRAFTFRLIHCAGRDEVWLDRRRMLYLPAGPCPKRVGFELYVSGVTAKVGVDFQKLDPGQVVVP